MFDQDMTKRKLDKEFLQTLKFSNFILSWVGLKLFYDEGSTKWEYFKCNGFFLLSFFVLFTCIVGESVYLLKAILHLENFLEITSLAPCIGMCTLGFVKMYTTWSTRRRMENFLYELSELWPDNVDGKRSEIKNSYKTRSHYVTQIYFWLFFVLIWIYNLYPLIELAFHVMLGGSASDVPRKQPYYIWYPFSDVEPFGQYVAIYVSQIWYGWTAIFGCVAADCLLFLVTNHICMFFELLQYDLEEMEPIEGDRPHQLELKLIVFIRKHLRLLRLTDGLEEANNIMILINFFCGSIIICLVGFQATAIGYKELIKFLLFLAATLAQVYIMCYYGDLLQTTSSGIAEAAYNCKWYYMMVHEQQIIKFIMARAQKPATVTAYKFTSVSMKSFTTILSSSWSYFTLLRTMYDPTKGIKYRASSS